ncbi:MAG: class I SAM-dependent methyltransferase [Candidatus Omnitrophica bacterium]|nr:class I SAM-dependent methyltransferase [Candidatus Omnitrophota bacterium]MDD5552838.1 class I SAM-dependent methyltransferase [Candidatus Omnitrophota bacterium]
MSIDKWHFNKMEEAINEPLVRGKMGIDIGSGCGYDTYIMAKNNPHVMVVSIDLSDGVHKTKELTFGLRNVRIIKSSILDISIKDNLFDFAYSFGVLHHTVSPGRGLAEIARILKRSAPAFIYLYEDHSDNIFKYAAVKIVRLIRLFTVKLPPQAVYILSWLLSPFVFMLFSLPAKVLRNFVATSSIAQKIPFNFGRGPFSLKGDLYDRFSAPIEFRFSKKGVYDLFSRAGFKDIFVTRMKDRAGWIARGYKK